MNNWKEEFDKLWGIDGKEYWNDPDCSAETIVNFITQLLEEQRKEILSEVQSEVEKKNWGALYIEGELKPIAGDISTIIESLKVK